MTDRVGQQLGNYRLLRLLGRGGFADVYLGEHAYLNKPAALKVLHLRLDEQDAAQFLREAQTLAGLDHPHIVRVLDFAVQDGMPFLVMGYAVGGTLRTRHPAGTRVPLEQILAYVSQVASALQYAHHQRLIHRDVKPENMLLDAREQVLLADFGLALLTPARSASTQAMDPSMAGTAPYLAPEQVQGQPRPASDQYALGVVVYEWLCGQRPFRGTPIEVALQHVSAPPPPLHEQLPDLSPAVAEVVMRALAKEPELRFPSVQDFAIALQRACYEAVSPHARPVAPPAPAEHVQEQPTSEPLSAPAPGPSPEREWQRDTAQSTARPGPMWKMPTPFTPLVGREQDVEAVCALLERPEIRLVTLLGTGGIGKTRLSIAGATALRESFTDGVCFVELAPISNPDLVMPTIAHELGIQERGAQPLVEQVKAALRDKQFLLVLDNFEQVVTAAPQVVDLLAACSKLKVVVTSRAALHLQGEQQVPVPPLALPDLKQLADLEVLAQYAAVALFLQRAQAVKPDFQMTTVNAHAIAEACVRLDGLPLAIELAAARIRLLPPQALLVRLSQRFRVLTSGTRNLPARQQTLRNTLQWSYDLLDTGEQQFFRRLAIFVGGCSLEAAEALCRGLGDLSTDVLNVMASLLDKCFVQQVEQAGNEPWFMMLETMREFGLEALAASGEMEATRQTHAAYYLALAEEAEPAWEGPLQAMWSERLEREHDNLRAAMQWSLERGEAGQGMELALRLGGALRRFWQVRGYLGEGRTFLEQVLARSQGDVTTARVKALIALGHLAVVRGDYKRVEAACKESLALCQQLGNRADSARSLYLLGWVTWMKGDLAAARSLLEQTVALFRQVGDKIGIAWSLMHLAITVGRQGDYSKGRVLFEENLARQRELGNKRGIAFSLCMFAQMLVDCQHDSATVRSLPEEGLALFREIGDKWGIATAFMLLGQVAFQQGDLPTASSLAEESVRLCKEVGHRWDTGRPIAIFASQAVTVLAKVADIQHDQVRARTLFKESLDIAREVGDKVLIASGLESLAGVVAAQGEPVWATLLWGAAEALRETIGAPMPPVEHASYERATAAVRMHLGESTFAAVWAEGRTMTPEQVLVAKEPEKTRQQISKGAAATPLAKAPTYPDGLTAREVEVLRLVAQGLTDAQAAEQLVISPRTVNFHLTSIYGKIGVSSRSAATRYAMEQHLV
jgi:predicted ATPase/DNA-binding CsgD family transcriptional regulator